MITSRIDCSTLECRAYVKLGAWKCKKNELFPYLIKTMSFFLIISSSYFALSSLEMKMKKIMENDTLDNSNIIEVLEIMCILKWQSLLKWYIWINHKQNLMNSITLFYHFGSFLLVF